MYNVAIIGAGPAGIFAALEITKLKPDWKVVLIEKGQRIEKRKCLLREGYAKCPTCKKCGLLCGWGGAGAFSDGKLTLTPDVGGHLVDYMDRKQVEDLIAYADQLYLDYGATDEVFGTDMKVFQELERQAVLAELKLTTGSLTPTFVSARPVGLAVRLAYTFTLTAWFPSMLSQPLSASATL